MRIATIILCVAAAGSPAVPREATTEALPFVIEALENTLRLENDGHGSSTVLTRVHILTEEGRQAYGKLYFPYVEGVSSVRVNRVRTLKADGSKVDTSLSDVLDMTPPVTQHAPTFSNLKFKVVPVADLQVGDRVVSEAVTTLEKSIVPGHFWMSHTPMRDYPVQTERVVLELPAKRVIRLEIDDAFPFEIKKRNRRRIYSWSLTNPEAQHGEILRRRLYSVSSLRSWSEVGGWYHRMFRERAKLTPELETLSETLTAGRQTPREKLQAIYDHVSMSVRYVAIQLGLGGYRPHFAQKTHTDEYGDCKDKHNLLSVLAGAAGLTVYPALMNTQRDLETDVPSPVEFNHVISVVVLGNEWRWLDSTPGATRLGYLPPAWRGRQALVVVGESESRLVTIPRESTVDERSRVSYGELSSF
jgi:hypothetical protein